MASHVRRQPVAALQSSGVVAIAGGAGQRRGAGLRHPPGCQPTGDHGAVHRVHRHHPVGGPLAAGHGNQPAAALDEVMVAGQRGGSAATPAATGDPPWRRRDQRPQSGPGGGHVVRAHRHVQVIVQVVEQVVHLARRGHRIVGDRRRHLGGAHQQTALPRQYENHPAILGARYQEAGVGRGKARAQHEVGAGADAQQRGAVGVVERAQAVHVGSGGVQHHARAHRPGGAGELIAHRRAGDTAARIGGESLHRQVVGDRGALLGGGHGEGEIHARVVELAVVVHHAAAQAARRSVAAHLLAQVREAGEDMLARHEFGAVQGILAGQAVVQPQADPVVGMLAELIQRHEDRQFVHQVRRQLQQRLPLAQRLAHQAELGAVDPLHRLFQVAHTAVYQLGAAAAGAAGEVGALHQRYPQPARGGIERAAAAGGAAADHQQVEALLLQPAQLLGALHPGALRDDCAPVHGRSRAPDTPPRGCNRPRWPPRTRGRRRRRAAVAEPNFRA